MKKLIQLALLCHDGSKDSYDASKTRIVLLYVTSVFNNKNDFLELSDLREDHWTPE